MMRFTSLITSYENWGLGQALGPRGPRRYSSLSAPCPNCLPDDQQNLLSFSAQYLLKPWKLPLSHGKRKDISGSYQGGNHGAARNQRGSQREARTCRRRLDQLFGFNDRDTRCLCYLGQFSIGALFRGISAQAGPG